MELSERETIIHKGRPHWIVFGWASCSVCSALVLCSAPILPQVAKRAKPVPSSPACWPSVLWSQLGGAVLPLGLVAGPDGAPRGLKDWHPTAEIRRVSTTDHRIRPGRVSCCRPPLQTTTR
jgi:hypothetical protein